MPRSPLERDHVVTATSQFRFRAWHRYVSEERLPPRRSLLARDAHVTATSDRGGHGLPTLERRRSAIRVMIRWIGGAVT